jgi:ribosomal protein S18 acetylase RimI-like enzyme
VPAIVSLVDSAYRDPLGGGSWTTEAHLVRGQRTDASEVLTLIAARTSRIVLAERGNELAGTVALQLSAEVVHLGMLAVRPQLQATGIGRVLIGEVERIIRSERLSPCIHMTVIAQRCDIIAWYVRRGFSVTGQTQPFPYGDAHVGSPVRQDLYFEVLEKRLPL